MKRKTNKTIKAFIIAVIVIVIGALVTMIVLINSNRMNNQKNDSISKMTDLEETDLEETDSKENGLKKADSKETDSALILRDAASYNESEEYIFVEEQYKLSEEDRICLYNAYASALATIGEGASWIDDMSNKYCEYLGSWNYYNGIAKDINNFAIKDIDNDGIEELIVEINNADNADKITVIYQYDLENDIYYREASFFPGAVFYENDIVFDEWSVNDLGYGNFIWPYSVYKYDKQQDSYFFICQVDSWNEEINEEGFPKEYDLDEDGNIVIISSSDETIYLDNDEYYKWVTGITEGSEKKTIELSPIYNSNYISYASEYVEYMAKKALSDSDNTDLGLIYATSQDYMADIEDLLFEKYGIEFYESEDENSKLASLDEQDVFKLDMLDLGTFYYLNRVKSIEIFGIYPDMDEIEAKETLKKIGFKMSKTGSFILGSSGWHIEIYLDIKETKLNSIKILWASDFAG